MLSVQIKSQSKPQDFSHQLAEGVKLFVANEGYEIPQAEITEALKQDINLIPQMLYEIIIKHGYDKDRVAASMARGAEILKVQTAENMAANGESLDNFKILKEIRVDDMKKFRSTLQVGERPSPVLPLETFYECQAPKL